jgi:polysaccharide export outer membrane protein
VLSQRCFAEDNANFGADFFYNKSQSDDTRRELAMRVMRFFICVICVAVLAACSNTSEVSIGAPSYDGNQFSEYKIGVGDELAINVWRNQELSVTVPVLPDGSFSMPLIGEIIAAGKTTDALGSEIQTALETFVRSPKVTVIVTDAISSDYLRRVRLTGAVEEPLSVPHRPGMTVLDLVLQGDGLSDFAVPNKAVLYRRSADGIKAYSVRLGDILNKGKLETNYELAPSDIVTIPERNF